MNTTILILDLDGVLITTPSWKADEMDFDGYSKFNEECVINFNKLLTFSDFDIWLSSTRRTVKSLYEFNSIFKNRNIKKSIKGFLPEYQDCKLRKDEILKFISENNYSDFIILDDDKSLNALDEKYKEKLIITDYQQGFNLEKLELAKEIITN